MINETVGQYRILAPLGEGGMGAVYAAEDTLLDLKVALKALKSELTKQPALVERFREEAKIQVKLNNPHVVKLYTFMRDGQDYYMVMEYVEGRTLGTLLERIGRFHFRDAIQLMMQVLDGLDHAHSMSVIHRDIKLNNIMVTNEGLVKVMDFGIARVLGSRRLTRAGNIVGTLDYISPEALNGQEITPAADIYSCGVMLYKMVTGKLPFISENDFLLARMHVEVPPPPPTTHVPDLPRKLEEVILKALAKNPADRYESAGRMADALHDVILLADEEARSQQQPGGGDSSAGPFWRRLVPGGRSTPPPASGGGAGSGQARQPSGGSAAVAAAATANRRIEELIAQNRMQEAMELCEFSMQSYPDDTTLRDLRARIEREKRHYEEDLKRAVQEIRAYLKKGLPEIAHSAAQDALERFSSETSIAELLEEAAEQLREKEESAKVVAGMEAEVQPLIKEGRFGEAVALISEAVSQHPDLPELASLLGRTVKAGKDAEKRRLVVECRAEAERFWKDGEFDRAIARVEQTRLTQPDDPSLLTLLRQLLEARDEARKKADLERVKRKVEELEAADDLAAAEAALEIALRRFPREKDLQARRAQISAQISKRRRDKDVEIAASRIRELIAKRDWTNTESEFLAAVEKLGPDPVFDSVQREADAALQEYHDGLQLAVDAVREQIQAEQFQDAAQAIARYRDTYKQESVIDTLADELKNAKREAERRQRFRELLDRAKDLIAAGSPEQAITLLDKASGEFGKESEWKGLLAEASVARAKKEEAAAIDSARSEANACAAKLDWEAGAAVLAKVLKKYPNAAGDLDAMRQEFTAKAAAKAHAEARERAERSSQREAERLAERNQWPEAMDTIEKTLRAFPDSSQLAEIRRELASRQAQWQQAEAIRLSIACIRQLLDLGKVDEAARTLEKDWARFPEAEEYLDLSLRIEKIQREAAAEKARTVAAAELEQLTDARRWSEAEDLFAEVTKQHGLNNRLQKARQALDQARDRYRGKIAQCQTAVERHVKQQQWPTAIGLCESLLREYPEAAEIRSLLTKTKEAFAAWQRDQEGKRVLGEVRRKLESGQWNDAEAEIGRGRKSYPELAAEFDSLLREVEAGRAAELRRQRIQAAVRQANDLAAARKWSDALAVVDAAAASDLVGEEIESTRRSIVAASERHAEAIAAACRQAASLIASGSWAEAIATLSRPEFEEHAEVRQLLAQAESGKQAAERQQRLEQRIAAARQASARTDWASAFRLLADAEREFTGEPVVAQVRREVEQAKELELRNARISSRIQEAERITDPLISIHILEREAQALGGDPDPRLADAIGRFRKIQEDREKELSRIWVESRGLLDQGKPAEALQALRGLPEWLTQNAELADIAAEAQAALQKAEAERRKAEIEAALREVDQHTAAGALQNARDVANWASGQFPEVQRFAEAVRQMEQALAVEARVQQLLSGYQFDAAAQALAAGGSTIAAERLGREIQQQRESFQRQAAEFETSVRVWIAQGMLDHAEQALRAEHRFSSVDVLRAELDQERDRLAAQKRVADYRSRIEKCWASSDFNAAEKVLRDAEGTDSTSAEYAEWRARQDQLRSEWERRKKLERLESDFKKALDANSLDRCRELALQAQTEFAGEAATAAIEQAFEQREALFREAEDGLKTCAEMIALGRFDEATAALARVPAMAPWADSAAKARKKIQEARKAAEKAERQAAAAAARLQQQQQAVTAPPPPPVTDSTLVMEPPPPAVSQQLEAPASGPGASRYALIGLAAVLLIGGGFWMLSRGGGGGGGTAELRVNPAALEFTVAGGSKTIAIEAASPVDFSASATEPWIELSEASGKTPKSLTVKVDAKGMPPAVHRGRIVVKGTADGSSLKEVAVVLKVEAKAIPILSVSPNQISVSFQVGQSAMPGARRISLTGVPAASCKVRVSRGADWMSASITGGAVVVSFQLSGKTAGNYAGEVEITPEGGSAVKVPVALSIQAFKL